MSDQQTFILKITSWLDAEGIPYMVCGSVASSFHGEPRSTNDVDLVIDPTERQLSALVKRAMESGMYADETSALEACRWRSMFNIIDMDSGWKVDLILRKERPFSREEFGRRIAVPLWGVDGPSVPVATPEDVILSKLDWSKQSGSDKQFRDAVGVATLHRNTMDWTYLRHWAEEIGVCEQLERLIQEEEES